MAQWGCCAKVNKKKYSFISEFIKFKLSDAASEYAVRTSIEETVIKTLALS